MPPNHWEHFEHGADIGVRGVGETLAAAYEQAALALTAVVTDVERVRDTVCVEVACAAPPGTAPDEALLLVDWLNAVISEMSIRGMLFRRFDVQLAPGCLRAAAWGEPVDRKRHQPAVEVKGATYTALEVCRTEAGLWVAQCVVDV